MQVLTMGLLVWLATTGVVQADIYVSRSTDGAYVLSNVHRPGRTYEKVISESTLVTSAPSSSAPQMIAQMPYAEMVAAAATANDLPPALLHAVIQAESRYNPAARSVKGAMGLMQLMPQTAKEMGVTDALDPAANIQGGARYLKRLMVMFDNNISLAVAAYNAGPDAVLSRGRIIPPFAETQRYVPSVLRQYRRLQGLAVDAPL